MAGQNFNFMSPPFFWGEKEEKVMAKKRTYPKEEVMRERDWYPIKGPRKRSTGQTKKNKANGRDDPGGNKRGGNIKR